MKMQYPTRKTNQYNQLQRKNQQEQVELKISKVYIDKTTAG